MSEEYNKLSDSEKKKEDWMNSKWRPMMGWMYMAVCMCDFVVFPVLWSMIQALHGGQVTNQWQPITLQGAGLFHMAMGAIIGVAAFGRTQEKLAGANNGGAGGAVGTTYVPPAPMPVAAPVAVAPKPAAPASVTLSSTGKTMPAPQVDEPL